MAELESGTVTAYVSVAAACGLRRVVPSGADQPYRSAVPGADLLRIAPPLPIIDSLEPNYAVSGATALELTLRGRHLGQVTSVSFHPPDGIAVGSTLADGADGTTLGSTVTLAADAPSGPRTVIVTTPAGISLPADILNPVTVEFEATGIPLGNSVELTVTPAVGTTVTALSNALEGDTLLSTASTSVELPQGHSTLMASITYTLVDSLGRSFEHYAGGENVPYGGATVSVKRGVARCRYRCVRR